ncbi:MAG: hypothetical protein ABI992_02145 [Chthoniobacterales bacterium]
MKTKLFVLCLLGLCVQTSQALACATCFGNYPGGNGGPPPTIEHMAIAIWILMAAIMSVLGGIGAFSFHLWRQGRLPLQPHLELTQEDLTQYD